MKAVQIILIGIALRYVILESSAHSIRIYLPAAKSVEGFVTNLTVSILPFSRKKDSLLNDHVEFPKFPVGVKVDDAVILTLSGESEGDGVINTSMLAMSPFFIVIS